MRTWLVNVTIQLKTKSYPHTHTTRVKATLVGTAANLATKEAFRELARSVKGKQLQEVSVKLTNLGDQEARAARQVETDTAAQSG